MLSNFGFGEMIVIALFGLFILGPERLPKAAADLGKVIRQLRSMADSTVSEFKAELPEDLANLDLPSIRSLRGRGHR